MDQFVKQLEYPEDQIFCESTKKIGLYYAIKTGRVYERNKYYNLLIYSTIENYSSLLVWWIAAQGWIDLFWKSWLRRFVAMIAVSY